MTSLKLASRALGWWLMGSLCALKELSNFGAGSPPNFVAGGRNNDLNSSTAIHPLKHHFLSTPAGTVRFGCHVQRHHPVFATMGGPTRESNCRSSLVSGTDVTASSFTSSVSSVNSLSVQAKDVLQFWFKDIDPENNVYASKNWFLGGPDFDQEIREKFGACLKLASDGALDGWQDTLRGRLALVIVLDQFSRNIHRKSPLAYANDEKARKITLETIAQGLDKQLGPLERNFLYLPLMHSESLEDHDRAATVFKGLAVEYSDNEQLHEQLLNSAAYEEKHRAVLEKFGRYPSRNEDLGRQSTPEELEHMSKGSSW